MGKKETWRILLIGIIFLMLLVWESADSAGQDPCAENITKFYKDIQQGGGRVLRCLEASKKDGDLQCREKLPEAGQRARSIMK